MRKSFPLPHEVLKYDRLYYKTYDTSSKYEHVHLYSYDKGIKPECINIKIHSASLHPKSRKQAVKVYAQTHIACHNTRKIFVIFYTFIGML